MRIQPWFLLHLVPLQHMPSAAQRTGVLPVCIASDGNQPPSPPKKYRRLAGRFLEEDEQNEGPAELPRRIADYEVMGYEESTFTMFSMTRSKRARAMWANETYKQRALSRRRQTLAHKGKAPREKPLRPPLTTGARVRSESMKLRHHDEEQWMAQRLAAGAEVRLRLTDDDHKRKLQLQRAEVAKKRAAKRKAAKRKAAKVQGVATARTPPDAAPT